METIKKYAGPAFGLLLFCGAMWFLFQKMQSISWQEFWQALGAISPLCLLGGGCLVALNYGVLTGNDYVALRYATTVGLLGPPPAETDPSPPRVGYRRVALASFLGYAFANNIGAVAAGIPIRARFYGAWGLRPTQILTLIGFLSLSFWVGFGVVGGWFLSLVEVPVPEDISLPVSSRVLGLIYLAGTLLYVALCTLWRRPVRIGRGLKMQPPGPDLMWPQIGFASLDLLIVSTTLYVLLPAGITATYPEVVTVYLLALAAAMLTQIPGGLGVLEVILMGLLGGADNEAAVLGSLLLFRIFYYILPLLLAALTLAIVEVRSRSLAPTAPTPPDAVGQPD